MTLRILILTLFVFTLSFAAAQEKPEGGEKADKSGIKKYSEVITKGAVTDDGLFKVHTIKEKVFFEIPFKEFGKELLLVTSQAKTQDGLGYGGDAVARRVVTWSRMYDKIFLKGMEYGAIAGEDLPISYSVQKATNPTILMAFDIKAFNDDSTAAVVEVTDMFTSDVAELGFSKGTRDRLKIKKVDSKRSYLEFSHSYPTNIETEATVTYDAGSPPGDNSLSSITMTFHHSMVLLPENPMMPRLEDARVGFFSTTRYDYGYDSHKAEERKYIARWRLEPKDAAAMRRGELVEPVKPIIFYIDRGVPEKWKSYLKQGVDDWQAAFEKAGFKNAIMGKYAPTVKEDPEWTGEDARYATIRWLPSNVQNAYGPHISDPRTGEILDADIGFFHNVMNLARDWYFVQAGNVDPRAQKLPLPDDLMGELLRYIAAHEVGHSLGFPHNHKSTSSYPVDSLRSKTFTEQYGTEASIMDYGRFNYIAQKGDGARTIPLVGPYDKFAAEWGYRPILDAKTPDDEKAALNKIAARQETEPYLRFGTGDRNDPTVQTEDLGDDPVKAAGYGMKNLVGVLDNLIAATTEEGKDYSTLEEMYGQVFSQRNRELGHVASYVGGVVRTERVAGQKGVVHTPVSRAKQKEAMAYLKKEGFRTPAEYIRPDIEALTEPTGMLNRVGAAHRNLLNILLNNDRMDRLINVDALSGKTRAYTLAEMLTDLRDAVWTELGSAKVAPDVYRRNLQRTYLDAIDSKINQGPPPSRPANFPAGRTWTPPTRVPGEARALLILELNDLDRAIGRAVPKVANRETRAHLEESRMKIKSILEPDSDKK